jgi:N4-gp56 family major capsid protein
MARSNYSSTAPETVKLWSKYLFTESLRRTVFSRFMVSDQKQNRLIQLLTDTVKESGDRVRVTLRGQLVGKGVVGDTAALRGSEESLTTFTDDISLDLLGYATDTGSPISRQRTAFDIDAEVNYALADWAKNKLDTVFFNHLCGFTANTEVADIGANAILAPDANHIVRTGAANTTDQAVGADTTAGLTLAPLHTLLARAKTLNPNPIKPAYIPELGGSYYVMFLHPDQVTDLMREKSANSVAYSDLQLSAMSGGKIKDNPFFTDVIGTFRNILLVEAPYVTRGVHSTTGLAVANTRRAVFAGAQAMGIAIAGDYKNGDNLFKSINQSDDYGRLQGKGLETIYGMKKMRFNGLDFATIVLTTYVSV